MSSTSFKVIFLNYINFKIDVKIFQTVLNKTNVIFYKYINYIKLQLLYFFIKCDTFYKILHHTFDNESTGIISQIYLYILKR